MFQFVNDGDKIPNGISVERACKIVYVTLELGKYSRCLRMRYNVSRKEFRCHYTKWITADEVAVRRDRRLRHYLRS